MGETFVEQIPNSPKANPLLGGIHPETFPKLQAFTDLPLCLTQYGFDAILILL